MAIKEPATRKQYALQPHRTSRVGGERTPRKRTSGPSALRQVRRRLVAFASRKVIAAQNRRRSSMIDALAADAVRQYKAGQTQNLRDFARERHIPLDAD